MRIELDDNRENMDQFYEALPLEAQEAWDKFEMDLAEGCDFEQMDYWRCTLSIVGIRFQYNITCEPFTVVYDSETRSRAFQFRTAGVGDAKLLDLLLKAPSDLISEIKEVLTLDLSPEQHKREQELLIKLLNL